MVKVGIVTCDHNSIYTGNKCLMSISERDRTFTKYRKDEPVEIVGFIACDGCPGDGLEFNPADIKKYGADVIHLLAPEVTHIRLCGVV
jgi:predicted metal-binding protein